MEEMMRTRATWVALMVLYTACLRSGAPRYLVSDSGGAYTSNDFEDICRRLQIQHETIESTQGERDQNLMETHVNIQRRLYDDQVSLARTPTELEPRHQAFIQTYNTTAHQGLLNDRRDRRVKDGRPGVFHPTRCASRAPGSRGRHTPPWSSIARGRGVERPRGHPHRSYCSLRWCQPHESGQFPTGVKEVLALCAADGLQVHRLSPAMVYCWARAASALLLHRLHDPRPDHFPHDALVVPLR